MINSLYQHVRVKVQLFDGSFISNTISCLLGVVQGESLSPFPFALYLNDMEEHLEQGTQGVSVGSTRLMLLLYADETVVMSETPEGLQHMLENL